MSKRVWSLMKTMLIVMKMQTPWITSNHNTNLPFTTLCPSEWIHSKNCTCSSPSIGEYWRVFVPLMASFLSSLNDCEIKRAENIRRGSVDIDCRGMWSVVAHKWKSPFSVSFLSLLRLGLRSLQFYCPHGLGQQLGIARVVHDTIIYIYIYIFICFRYLSHFHLFPLQNQLWL